MIISTGGQTRWKNSWAPSEVVRLTMGANGEESTFLITPFGERVLAGFQAPTVDPTLLVSAGGTLAQDTWYSYRYVYASSNYPYVQNAQTTANGELWPRSNPSGYDTDVTTVANKTITVTVTKTTRSDVDKILVYRTSGHSSQALAEAAAEAGEMFYIATAENNGIAGTTTVVDNGLTDTGEELEADNYTADIFRYVVFDGTYWWGIGNPEFSAPVTLDGTNVVTQSGPYSWFNGRDGQTATFAGINSGGSDGRGTFYFKWGDGQTASLYEDAALTTPASLPYTGTTVIHIQGPASTLYRSKAFNPFSWGFTETIVNDDASTTKIPQSFALVLGGGAATALAVAGNPRKLKVDFENPQKCISLDLAFAESDQFGSTAQDIDLTGSVTTHHAQFHGFVGESPALFGMDTYNGNIVVFTGTGHQIISDALGDFLLSLDRTNNAHHFFCGAYDPETECNFFSVRYYDTTVRNNVVIWMHGPTQEWGWYFDSDILSVSTILDSDTNERYLLGGTESGNIGRLWDPDTHVNWTSDTPWKNNLKILSTSLAGNNFNIGVLTPMYGSPEKFGQPIVGLDAAAGTFTVTGTPWLQAGDSVILINAGNESFDTGTVESISGSTVTLTGSISSIGPDYAIPWTNRTDGEFAVIQSPDGKDEWFVSVSIESVDLTGDDASVWNVSEYIHRGETEVIIPSGTAPWPNDSRIIFGCIPCYWRSYFDLGSPTSNKSQLDAWVTCANVSSAEQEAPYSLAATLSGRYYPEYDEESTVARTTLMKRNVRPGGSVDSFTWNKGDIPSSSLPQCGWELAQIGTEAFTLYNLNLNMREDT